MRWFWILPALALTLPSARGQEAEKLLTPSDAALLAYDDVRALTAEAAARTRYLLLPNLPAKERAKLAIVLAGHCNQLSRSSDLTAPRSMADGRLLAVDLDDYGWKAATWDQFAEADPYFYATVETEVEVKELVEYGRWEYPGGEKTWVKTRDVPEVRKKRLKTRVLAPWLASNEARRKAVEGLAALTGAKAPLVHAATFLDNTGAAGDGRKPDYYDLLGIKDEQGFQALVGAEVAKDVAFSRDLLGAISISGVTQEPRAIQRIEKRGGAYWRTADVNRGEGKGEKNALRILGSDKAGKPRLRFDASEQYAHLPNSLWAFGLFNAAGVRQDAAPDRVAVDATPLTRNNHRIAVCVSCIRCHAAGGLQPLDDEWVRGVFTPPPLDLLAGAKVDYEEVRRLRQQYRRKLEPAIEGDRKRYAAALLEATGMKPEEWAVEFPKAWQAAADPTVTLEWAARDLGVTPETVRKALDRQIRTKGSVDTVVAVFLLPEGRRKSLTVTQWRESIPILESYLSEAEK